jgi:hypothetical protein
LRFTARTSWPVSTPYISAKSESSMTLCPRIRRIHETRAKFDANFRAKPGPVSQISIPRITTRGSAPS